MRAVDLRYAQRLRERGWLPVEPELVTPELSRLVSYQRALAEVTRG